MAKAKVRLFFDEKLTVLKYTPIGERPHPFVTVWMPRVPNAGETVRCELPKSFVDKEVFGVVTEVHYPVRAGFLGWLRGWLFAPEAGVTLVPAPAT